MWYNTPIFSEIKGVSYKSTQYGTEVDNVAFRCQVLNNQKSGLICYM